MSWNYRVTRVLVGEEFLYEIREVYYNDHGQPTGWTEKPVHPLAETMGDLAADLRQMLEALDKPVLCLSADLNTLEGVAEDEAVSQ